MRDEAARMIRFGMVGTTNFVVTLAVFTLLGHLGLPAPVASALAFGAGAVNGYVLNSRWTFRSTGGPGRVARYAAVQLLGAGCSAVGMVIVRGDLELRRVIAELAVIPVVTVITYTLCRRVVFTP
jgi:putative flippase GtrA